MDDLESLMNEKYFLLKHIYSRCQYLNDEFILYDTFKQLGPDTKISIRSLTRYMKELEKDGFLVKSKQRLKKFIIPEEKKILLEKLFNLTGTL